MRSKWIILCFSYLSMIAMFVPYVGYSLGSLNIMEEFQVNYSAIGLLATFTGIAGGLSLPLAGYLSDKIGCKKLIIYGLFILIIGQLLFALAPIYAVLVISRIFSGIGIGILIVAPYTLVVQWFSASNAAGFSMGTMLSTDGVGTLVATYAFGALVILIGWQMSALVSCLFIGVVIILCSIFLEDTPKNSTQEHTQFNAPTLLKLLKHRNIISGAVVISALFSVFNLAVYWVPTILIEEALWSESTAGFTSAIFPLVGILGSILFGTISDKFQKRKIFIVISQIGLALSFLALSYFYLEQSYLALAILLGLAGFFAYGASSAAYALVSDTVGSHELGLANGLVIGIGMTVGGLIVPLLIGGVKDVFSSYTIGFIVIAIYLFVFLIVISVVTKDIVTPSYVKPSKKVEEIKIL